MFDVYNSFMGYGRSIPRAFCSLTVKLTRQLCMYMQATKMRPVVIRLVRFGRFFRKSASPMAWNLLRVPIPPCGCTSPS